MTTPTPTTPTPTTPTPTTTTDNLNNRYSTLLNILYRAECYFNSEALNVTPDGTHSNLIVPEMIDSLLQELATASKRTITARNLARKEQA